MLDPHQIIATALIIFATATVVSTIGFGLGITATPMLLLVLEPQTVIVTVNVVSSLIFVLILVQSRQELPTRKIAPIAIVAALGAPIGVLALTIVDPSLLRISIAVLVIALSAATALNFHTMMPKSRLFGLTIGFGTGGLVAGLGIGGPIMALFLLGQKMRGPVLRVSLAFYFLGMSIITLLGYGIAGFYTSERISLLLFVTVPALGGFWVGSMLLQQMNEVIFKRGVLVVIILSSIMVLLREILSS